jgi:protein-disulfide isomerase
MQNKTTNIIIGVLVFLLIISSFFIGTLWTKVQYLDGGNPLGADPNFPNQPSAPQLDVSKVPLPTNEDRILGDVQTAAVTIIEYSDMNCGFCQRFHPTMKQIMEDYAGDVAWIYRHLPVLGSNKQAEAAECAGKLGGNNAFWAYTDAYFEQITGTADAGNEASWISLAEAQGLNGAAFTECLNSGEMANKVATDSEGARAVGINGTPGSVIVVDNVGVDSIPGALPLEDVKRLLDKYL